MRASAAEYLAHLQALLPPGAAWTREPDAVLTRILDAQAAGLARAHNRGLALLEEADPRTTVELLAEWERMCGLPDACSAGTAATLQERRAAVLARLTARGGQSKRYFVGLASAFGYAATVQEFRPFRAGRARAGHALTNTDAWRHAWRVHVGSASMRPFRAGASAAGEPLRRWGDAGMECVIRRRAPAHTLVTFAYTPPPALLVDGGDVIVLETGDAIEV